MSELHVKPCPFCGSERLSFEGRDEGTYVACSDCGATSGECNNDAAAAEAWNRRPASPPSPVEQQASVAAQPSERADELMVAVNLAGEARLVRRSEWRPKPGDLAEQIADAQRCIAETPPLLRAAQPSEADVDGIMDLIVSYGNAQYDLAQRGNASPQVTAELRKRKDAAGERVAEAISRLRGQRQFSEGEREACTHAAEDFEGWVEAMEKNLAEPDYACAVPDPEAHRESTRNEVTRLRKYAAHGMSSREAAGLLGRSMGAVKFKAMTERVSFRAIRQPKGVQKKLAAKRRKHGMSATLRRAA